MMEFWQISKIFAFIVTHKDVISLHYQMTEKSRLEAKGFVITEASGPCFSWGMWDHDQIVL